MVPVIFDDLRIELDIFVVSDIDCSYELLIGRNAIQHSDIEIVTDSLGSRLRRKSVPERSFLNMLQKHCHGDSFSELSFIMAHLDDSLQNKIKAIFQKYPSVLEAIGSVKTSELDVKLKNDDTVL